MSAQEEKKREWRDDYRALAEMTVEDLQAAVDQLPEEIRTRLAQGPREYRWACGVCDSFGGPAFYNKVGKPGGLQVDVTDPMWVAFGYHEVPKKDMTHANHQWYGPLANDVYERCLATYRAAGWTGDAPGPNA